MTIKHDALTTARAEALFGNLLTTSSRPPCGEVDGAIRVAVAPAVTSVGAPEATA